MRHIFPLIRPQRSRGGKEMKGVVEADVAVVAWDNYWDRFDSLIGGQTNMQWGLDLAGRGLGFCLYSNGSIWCFFIFIFSPFCDEHLSVNSTCVVLFNISGKHFENTWREGKKRFGFNFNKYNNNNSDHGVHKYVWSLISSHRSQLSQKNSGIRQTAATHGPAIGCFAHQNTLMLLRLKQTHTFAHLCTNLVSLKRKGGMLHTHKAGWRGDGSLAHRSTFSDL